MFTKAKYGEYQITPNLMHAHAMHLRQSYYETKHYESAVLEELHHQANHLSRQILRDCIIREHIYNKNQDKKALHELGIRRIPIEELLEELQQLHEDHEAEYKRLNIHHTPLTPIGITHPLPTGAATYTQKTKKLAAQSVHLHWQAIKIATLHQELKSQKWFEAFIRNYPEKEIALRRFRVENMHENLYHRAINEAEQAGWLAVQQVHRLNKRTYKLIPQNAHHASKLYDREIIFLDSMLAWYHDDETHAWLHMHKTGSAKKKTLRTRMKDLLNKVTGTQPYPPQLPVDPVLPDGHWENHLRLNHKNTKPATKTDCTPNNQCDTIELHSIAEPPLPHTTGALASGRGRAE